MAAIFPGAVATQIQLLTAVNNAMVILDADVDIDDDVITVDDASPLPASGYMTFVDTDEVIYYTGKTLNTLTGCTRGADGTTASAHLAGVDLEMRWNAAFHNTLTLEMVSIEDNLRDRFGLNTDIVVPTGVAFQITDGLGIGAAVSSKAMLSLTSTTKGFLPARMTTTQRDAITSVPEGLIVYNTTTHQHNVHNGTSWKAHVTSSDIVNADINASAAIAYSKLALTGAILNADLAGSIAYSKLTLTTSIVNGDISASAAIAMSKLAALTVSRAMVTDGSGFHTVATTTATEIGYVNGVTSAIQTQIDATVKLTGAQTVAGSKNLVGPTGMNTSDATQLGYHSLTIAKDVAAPGDHTNNAQLGLCGSTSLLKQMSLGFDTTNNYGFLQAAIQSSTFNPIVINPDGGAVRIRGTDTNDDAAAGFVGEFVEGSLSAGAPTALVTGTAKTITSISLTAGDWDVWGMVGYSPGGTINYCEQSISLTNNTYGGDTHSTVTIFQSGMSPAVAAEKFAVHPRRIAIASTTTVYLVAQSAFGTSMSAWGVIRGRRRR